MVARGTRDRGGVGRYLGTLLAAWPAASRWRPQLIDPYGRAGAAVMPIVFAAACVRTLVLAACGRIDLLHVHACARGSFLRKGMLTVLASWFGVPVILHLHAPDFDAFHRALPAVGRRFVRAVFRRADRVVALGRDWRDVLVRDVGLPPSQIVVLHSGVRGRDRMADRPAGPPRIVFSGNLVERKGLPEFLRALASEAVRPLPWTARVLGGGDLVRWRAEAAHLGLADRVVFEGWVSEARVREVLGESSIFVLPSHAEGLSIALLEAMADGLAIVTTRAGGAGEVLAEGESALFVPAGDAGAIAAALVRLLQDDALRARLQAGARQRFLDGHDIDAYCRSLEALYDEVSTGRRQAANPA